jgi:hypothetical protein
MTEKPLTIKDLHCHNCNHYWYSGPYPEDEYRDDSPMREDIGCTCNGKIEPLTPQQIQQTEIRGCASHDKAFQVIAGPVIEELEKEIADQKDLIEHTNGHHKEIHEYIFNTLEYAITLLKNGVGKK